MTVPTLATPTSAELAQPYVTPAMFQAYPTWLDLDNLIPGGLAALQADVLADVLLAATTWAVDQQLKGMRLDAHWVQGENRRIRAGGSGRLHIKPYDIPIRMVTALSYGPDPSMLTALGLPDSSMWFEDGRDMSFLPGGGGYQFTGPAIQFGPRTRPYDLTYISWSYGAGFPSTLMPAGVATAASEVTVADPTCVLPGDVLRIYDITEGSQTAQNEALTVSPDYSPAMPTWPPVPTPIPLAAPTQYAHAAGVGITGMPRLAMQAIIAYGVALLMRQDVSEEEPASPFGPAARTTEGSGTAGKAGGLVNDAAGWLSKYAPTLRPAPA